MFKSNNPLHIEVWLDRKADNEEELKLRIVNFLQRVPLKYDELIEVQNDEELKNCKGLWIEKYKYNGATVNISENKEFHFFNTYDDHVSFELEFLDIKNEDSTGESNQVAVKHFLLPAKSFVGLWSCLQMDKDVKEKLLRFSLCSLMMKSYKLNPHKISCNNLIVLYGPTGTGKTTLCKALAQKLSIRQQHQYSYTHLIEVNSHNLLSKWFSESGKIIGGLFNHVRDLAYDPKNLIVVLIDEVESIAYDRNSLNNHEPKDALRVVNSLLTELDSLKIFSNVLILATSNLENTIDSAFLDRADIKIKIGLPNLEARKGMFEGILKELWAKGVLETNCDKCDKNESMTEYLAKISDGLSGRSISKLPYLVLSELIGISDFETNLVLSKFESSIQESILMNKIK